MGKRLSFRRILPAALFLSVPLAHSTPLAALANGGDLHAGETATGIPLVALWISGAALAAGFLMLLRSWAASRRSPGVGRAADGLDSGVARSEASGDATGDATGGTTGDATGGTTGDAKEGPRGGI